MPATSISSFTIPSDALLNSAIFSGRSWRRTVSSSPSSIARPPSPDIDTTCRPGNASWAPIACGSAFAIVPCLHEPITRRRPFGVR